MSRSYRKTPITGWAVAASEKEDKRKWHRAWRRADRCARRADPEAHVDHREHSNPWNMAKDGKVYWLAHERGKKWMRK